MSDGTWGRRASLAVLCNPDSGRVRRSRDAIRFLADSLGSEAFREAATPAEITAVVADAVSAGAETLAVIGGDGTIHAVLTALHSVAPDGDWPRLAPLPAGSTNMTALDLGAGGDLRRALRALEGWRGGSTDAMTSVSRAPLRLDRAGQPCLSGMFFGTGVIATGVEFFRRRVRERGLAGEGWSLLSVARVLMAMARGGDDGSGARRLSWRLGGRPARELSARACLVSSLGRLLLGMRPYWGTEDGPLHLTVIDEEARAPWTSLWRVAAGRPGTRLTPERGYWSHDIQEVELHFDGSFVMDGEVYEARRADGAVTIAVSREVRWLVPERSGDRE